MSMRTYNETWMESIIKKRYIKQTKVSKHQLHEH